MADQKISELAAAGALTGTELVETVQGGVNVQTTTQDIADLGGGGVSSVNSQTGVVVLDAGDIGNTPGGGIAANNVQTAINELDTEKESITNKATDFTTLNDTLYPSVQAVENRIISATAGLNWKASVRVATTAAQTLASDFENGDTIDGVVLATGNRILIKNQADQTTNGIYTVNASGAPTRSTDADIANELEGAAVTVQEGTSNANTTWLQITDSITLGVSNIVWGQFGSSVPDSSETVKGIIEIATQAEVTTGTDDLRVVTPLKLATGLNARIMAQFTTATSTTAYTGTTSPTIAAYATGQLFQVKIHATSTGAATLNLNSIGAKKVFTNATNQAVAGDLVINMLYLFIYDAALDSAAGGFMIANGSILRRLTVAGAFAEQPYFNSSLGYYVFNPQASTIIPRMYLIPNNPGSGTTSKLELFNTDYQADSVAYSGLNLFTTSATNEIHIGPNRGGSGVRMKMTLGIYTASSLESLTSRIVFNTDNTVDIYSGGFNHRSVSGTAFIGVNSAGSILLSSSAGTSGQVLTSAGSAAPPTWQTPAVIQSTTTDTTGGTITLNMNSLTQRIHVGTATFATPKTIALSNTTNALAFSFIFEVTNVAAVITVPADWIFQTADFDGVDWTPPATGRFKFIGVFNGTEWFVDANGPYS